MTVPALEVHGLRKSFGGVTATRDVSLTVMPGERRLLIGPNGAGKTTLFNLVTGDLRADGGSVRLFGQELLGLPVRGRVRRGLGRTYQVLTLFPQETLAHNVALALIGAGSTGWLPWGAFAHRRALHDAAEAALAQVGLASLASRIVAETAYGERRRLELAMALAQRPRVLLLDEPLAGLSAPERDTVAAVLNTLPQDIAIVLIEHDMDMALAFAERITLLNFGNVVLEGTRAEVIADPRTREVYLGE
ncbi:MAG TPA: ABC transporter ATP-binding protein [Acetobacteraceae bacterium]